MLSDISLDKEGFDNAKCIYHEALQEVATAMIYLSNRARHPNSRTLRKEIPCDLTHHIATAWQQMSENAYFHSSINIFLNLTHS